MRQLPIAVGLQMLHWHDVANGRQVQWSFPMQSSASVDIAAQMKAAIDSDNGNESFS